ncbi:prepilin-type N-terminal cleavage/methylation domain-containing protein [Planctomycetales bacterium ZRK34]|nr:prepilin-type N-terminal cleavage/methylation domain-containing protein [Planctomycetales bacterium ZRK34]
MKRHAFTLIELLVVVAIIALLISILMPSLAKAKATARMVTCSSILKQMGISAGIYATEYRGWLIPQTVPSPGFTANRREWFQNKAFYTYMNMDPPENRHFYNAPRGLICPDAAWVLEHPADVIDIGSTGLKYTAAAPVDFNGLYRLDLSYGMNPVDMPPWRDKSDQDLSGKIARGIKQVDVVDPSRKVYIMDSMWSDPTGGGRTKYPDNPDATFIAPANQWATAWRHFYEGEDLTNATGLCNVLHYDLHVEPLRAGYDPDFPINDNTRWNPNPAIDYSKYPVN